VQRHMRHIDGTTLIPYELYKDEAKLARWGSLIEDQGIEVLGPLPGDGKTKNYVYAQAYPKGDEPAGIYEDVVIITVEY